MKMTTILRNNRELYKRLYGYRTCEVCGQTFAVHFGSIAHTCKDCCRANARENAARAESRAQATATRRLRCGQKFNYWKSGNKMEHRVIYEQYLGRELTPTEKIHHIDGNKRNNDISNLRLFASQAEHLAYHREVNATMAILNDLFVQYGEISYYTQNDNFIEKLNSLSLDSVEEAEKLNKNWYDDHEGFIAFIKIYLSEKEKKEMNKMKRNYIMDSDLEGANIYFYEDDREMKDIVKDYLDARVEAGDIEYYNQIFELSKNEFLTEISGEVYKIKLEEKYDLEYILSCYREINADNFEELEEKIYYMLSTIPDDELEEALEEKYMFKDFKNYEFTNFLYDYLACRKED